MVIMSSRACVGCSWAPSPALITDWRTTLESMCGEPAALCRRTMMSGFMASRFRAVSTKVSPLTTLLVEVAMLIVSALRRLAAISKEVRVRVLGS